MLSEEEKKAIKNLENLSEFGLSATLNQTDLDKMDIILKLIKKQQEEIVKYKALYERALSDVVKADKIIELMARAFKQDDVK